MQQQQQYIITTTTAAARRKLQRGSENLFKAKQAAEEAEEEEGKEDKEEEAVENANSRMHLQSESLAANLHHLDHNEVRQRCRLWATATCNWELQSLENRGTEGGRSTRMGSTTTTMSLGQLGSVPLPLLHHRHVHLNLQLLEGQLDLVDWYWGRHWEWICDCHVRKLHSTRRELRTFGPAT